MQRTNVKILQAAESIAKNCAEELPLAKLSAEAGLSPFHFQRSFKAAIGLTPKQFQEACRLRKLKKELREGDDILDAIFSAGFGSVSRVYEKVDGRLGMTPSEYRSGGQQVEVTHVTLDTSFGLLMIAATDRGVCFVQFGNSEEALEKELRLEFPAARLMQARRPLSEDLSRWVNALEAHLSGEAPASSVPLDIQATAFQMRVWRYLQSIPYGEVRSYADVAKGIGAPQSVRAVAGACARNPVAILVPCHRVIRQSGQLGGYRWGIERKRRMLERERPAAYSSHSASNF